MNILKFFTAAPKIADDIFDKDKGLLSKAGAWIGNQQFTKEEQSEANAVMVKGVTDYAIATLGENTERSKGRREIAFLIMRFYVLLLFWCCLVYPFDKEWALFIGGIATSGSLVSFVGGVSAFFFGSHFWSSHVKGK